MPPRIPGTRAEPEKARATAAAKPMKPRDETVRNFFKSLRGKPPAAPPVANPHAAKGSMEKQQQLADEYLKN